MIDISQVPPRVSPQMVQQISLDAQLENVNSSFADFTQFPESVVQVRPILIYTHYEGLPSFLFAWRVRLLWFVMRSTLNEAQVNFVTISRGVETDKIALLGKSEQIEPKLMNRNLLRAFHFPTRFSTSTSGFRFVVVDRTGLH